MPRRNREQSLDFYRNTIAGVAQHLQQQNSVDRAEERIKQAATILKDANLRSMIDFPTFPRVEGMIYGFDVPSRVNLILVELDDRGIPREVLLAAAISAGVITSGKTARTNLKNRLAGARKQIKNSAAAAREAVETRRNSELWSDPAFVARLPAPEVVIAECEEQLRAELVAVGVDVDEVLAAARSRNIDRMNSDSAVVPTA